jgi:hypothetical protein
VPIQSITTTPVRQAGPLRRFAALVLLDQRFGRDAELA